MELFEKWYNCYYQVVRQILMEASHRPISKNRMNELSMKYGFLESGLSIIPKLIGGQWPLLTKEEADSGYRSALKHQEALQPGALPLTALQKSWLKALLTDPRIRLFLSEDELCQAEHWLNDTEPLFRQEDFYYFDQYSDGDDYSSPAYREHFRTILSALDTQTPLTIDYENQKKRITVFTVLPCQLQYSAKDDKFRLSCLQKSNRGWGRYFMLNLSRINRCCVYSPDSSKQNQPDTPSASGALQSKPSITDASGTLQPKPSITDASGTLQPKPTAAPALRFRLTHPAKEPVTIQISGERNSLERCMLHFANYEKHTRYDEEKKVWISSIYYDLADETELLMEILSFGPVIQVLGSESFLCQIRERVKKQHDLFYAREN